MISLSNLRFARCAAACLWEGCGEYIRLTVPAASAAIRWFYKLIAFFASITTSNSKIQRAHRAHEFIVEQSGEAFLVACITAEQSSPNRWVSIANKSVT